MHLKTWILPIAGGGAVALAEHPLARAAAHGPASAWGEVAEALRAELQVAEAERAGLGGRVGPKREADWLLGRAAAKAAMGQVAGLAPHLMQVAVDPQGRPSPGGPWWHGLVAPGWGLSLAHSMGRALAVVCPGPVGCDLEAGDAPAEAGWRFFLRPEELEACGGDEELAMAAWVAKEAAFKALGGPPGGMLALRLEAPPQAEAGLVGPQGERLAIALGRATFGRWAIARPLG